MSIKRTTKYALAMVITTAGLGLPAFAQADTTVLQTATTVVYEAKDGKIAKLTGAGVMDAHVSTHPSGLIAMTWTDSVYDVDSAERKNGKSEVQGAIGLAHLDPTKGIVVDQSRIMLPTLNGERTYMRPNVSIAQDGEYMISIFASEDNGQTNNPQAVAWVFDKTGKMLDITNTTRNGNEQKKPTNLIQLSGKNDNQQYGPHSVCPMGKQPDGSDGFLVGVQRQNQNAYVMKVLVKPDGAGGARVTVPIFTRVVENAQHNRPQVACHQPGNTSENYLVTSVEANSQPADIGIRAINFNASTGKFTSKLIAKSNPGKNVYMVQPSAAEISGGIGAIEYQVSNPVRKNKNGNGHAGGVNVSACATLKLDDLSVVETMSPCSPVQRHSHGISAKFGQGEGQPGLAVIAGSSTGTGRGMVQLIPIDGTTGKFLDRTATDKPKADATNKLFTIAKYSDIANLPARAKRNPNDQGAGFLYGVGSVKNPGHGVAGGFMSDVSEFGIYVVPGFAKDPTTVPAPDPKAGNNAIRQRESLYLSAVPQRWDAAQVAPGGVVDNGAVTPGPSPTQPGNAGDGAGGVEDDVATDPSTVPAATDCYSEEANCGRGASAGESGGCTVGKTGTAGGGGAAVLGLALAGVLFLARRKREEA